MNKSFAALALAAASVIVLSGCSSTSQADDGRVQVVASTNVYGSLAAQIGGDRVDVTSLIDSAAKDPHSYEATARDRLAAQKADLVIQNGGGYDAFMTELVDGSDATVITAAEFSHDYPGAEGNEGHDHADDHAEEDAHEHADDHADEEGAHAGHSHIAGFNEHVWFDVHTISHVVEHVSADLIELDPAGKTDYTAATDELLADLEKIEGELAALHETNEGGKVFITEPLPGLLAAAAGLDDVAPDGFASAVEEGNDVAPATLLEALQVIGSGDVRAVLATAQTGGAETERVISAADDAGIPVIEFSELLQDGQSYAEWMRAAMADLSSGLE